MLLRTYIIISDNYRHNAKASSYLEPRRLLLQLLCLIGRVIKSLRVVIILLRQDSYDYFTMPLGLLRQYIYIYICLRIIIIIIHDGFNYGRLYKGWIFSREA